jgi:hypothetical protein
MVDGMNITYETVKVVNGVKAMQVEWNGLEVVKYAELANGAVRLLWVIERPEDFTGLPEALESVLEALEGKLVAA